MAITYERLGFFNARLEQRMNESGLSVRELATKAGSSYEHIRKLIMGHSLPSDSMVEKLSSALHLSKKEMTRRVVKDKMIFRFGDAAWQAAGIDPRAAPCYILFPLLTHSEREFLLVQIRAVAAVNRTQKDGVSRSKLKNSQ
jgi:transcriptional regulator with XRE-family HTH domain